MARPGSADTEVCREHSSRASRMWSVDFMGRVSASSTHTCGSCACYRVLAVLTLSCINNADVEGSQAWIMTRRSFDSVVPVWRIQKTPFVFSCSCLFWFFFFNPGRLNNVAPVEIKLAWLV